MIDDKTIDEYAEKIRLLDPFGLMQVRQYLMGRRYGPGTCDALERLIDVAFEGADDDRKTYECAYSKQGRWQPKRTEIAEDVLIEQLERTVSIHLDRIELSKKELRRAWQRMRRAKGPVEAEKWLRRMLERLGYPDNFMGLGDG